MNSEFTFLLAAPVPVLPALVPGEVGAVLVAVAPALPPGPAVIGPPVEIVQSQPDLVSGTLHCAVTLKVNKCFIL